MNPIMQNNEFKSLWEDKEKWNNFIKMFECVYSFFVDKNLCPMICFGTLLGYRRNNGKQIPWDGDIDIVLYKNDFNDVYDEFLFAYVCYWIWPITLP